MSDTPDKIPLRRVSVELPPISMQRLDRLKQLTDATTYAEVFRAALRSYEEHVVTQQKNMGA